MCSVRKKVPHPSHPHLPVKRIPPKSITPQSKGLAFGLVDVSGPVCNDNITAVPCRETPQQANSMEATHASDIATDASHLAPYHFFNPHRILNYSTTEILPRACDGWRVKSCQNGLQGTFQGSLGNPGNFSLAVYQQFPVLFDRVIFVDFAFKRTEILSSVFEGVPSNSPLSTGQMAVVSSKLFQVGRQHTQTHARAQTQQSDLNRRSYRAAPAVLPDAGLRSPSVCWS